MKRYLSPDQFERVAEDFAFLIEKIHRSHGELDLRLREGSFNLYYRGNSLAEVNVKKKDYLITIHKKFMSNVMRADRRFKVGWIERNGYLAIGLPSELLHPFFQTKYLNRLKSNIKKVGFSEELTFEQMLITDNLNRPDFLIIDRQVTDSSLHPRKLDLLALRQVEGNKFRFLVIEVKLGNNPELRGKVGEQLKIYVKHVESHFDAWKAGFEETYRQMKQLQLFKLPKHEAVEIVPGIEALVIVGGYSGIAKESKNELEKQYPNIDVRILSHQL